MCKVTNIFQVQLLLNGVYCFEHVPQHYRYMKKGKKTAKVQPAGHSTPSRNNLGNTKESA